MDYADDRRKSAPPISDALRYSRIALIVFNLFFWASGCALLAVGLRLRVDKNIVNLQKMVNLDPNDPALETAALLLSSAGGLIFMVGFCGCFGALRYNKFMIGCYLGFLGIVMATELAAGAMALKKKEEVILKLKTTFLKKIQEKYVANGTVAAGVDYVQHRFSCCGVNGYLDYRGSVHTVATNQSVPNSCCIMLNLADVDYDKPNYLALEDCHVDAKKNDIQSSTSLYTMGCYTSVKDWTEQNLQSVVMVGLVFAFMQILGFVATIYLYKNITRMDPYAEQTEQTEAAL